jgi:hypothetical protein
MTRDDAYFVRLDAERFRPTELDRRRVVDD